MSVARAFREGIVLCSMDTRAELVNVFLRPKFERYVPHDDRVQYLSRILARMKLVLVDVSISACRDPRDDKFLELTVSGNANVLITGDADLLAMHPFQGVPILSPSAYLAL
jgi:uncharacterized protein